MIVRNTSLRPWRCEPKNNENKPEKNARVNQEEHEKRAMKNLKCWDLGT